VQLSQALNSRRIARSLVTVFLLTFIQNIAAPIVTPGITTPKAEAVEVAYANATGGTDLVVPAGVYSIRITARGGAGGTGGNDGSSALGLPSSQVGSTEATFAVTPGDRITIYPGGAGGNGVSSLSAAAGGSAGAASIPTNSNIRTPSLSANGTFSDQFIINGGAGGAAGAGGSSGGAGGGGAASLVAINGELALVAGGGGGGGGGSGAGAIAWNGTFVSSGSATGATGIGGGTCGNSDGGGSGGGGGGWFGGAAGAVTRPAGGECAGAGGSPGANFVSNSGSSVVNTRIAANGAGAVTYDFTYEAFTNCATDVQTNDIYTIVKVTRTSSCTWAVPATVSTVDLFLVGGGGGGAGDAGPGGNGGYALSRTAIPVTPNSNLTLKVGYGGAGSNWGFFSNGFVGDSSTVQTASGSLYFALGGQTGSNGPSVAATTPTTAGNGSFAGGMGGSGAGCNGSGNPGKRGISNYFYGTLNTYAGGGGSGACPNSAATTPAAGADGGGQGGYASSATVNQPGSNGTNGTGGGGGAGTATGSGLKLPAGKGGSGVILIRYATNSADAFPAALSSALAARWNPSDLQVLDSTRKGWIDSTGTNASVTNDGFISGAPTVTTQGTTDSSNPTGSSKTLLTASGGTADRVTLKDLPTGYTLFHVARYIRGGATQRIIGASSGNWLSGFWSGNDAVTHHNGWLTTSSRPTQYKWVLSSDRNTVYRADGKDVSLNADAVAAQSTSSGFGINNWSAEYSNWQVADVIVFNRELSPYENRLMEIYISRIYGLTLTDDSTSSETDTASTMNGNYYYTQYNYSNNLNDTFTVMGWIKPSTTCATNECGFFGRELSLVLRAYQGKIWYALYGGSEWEWTDTGINVGYNEWHHFAIVKRLPGNNSASMDFYLDGQFIGTKPGNPYRAASTPAATISNSTTVNQPNAWTYVGIRYENSNSYYPMYGSLDEFKVWKVARTAAQIAEDMHSSDPSSPQLQMYYDFNKSVASSSTMQVPNLGGGGPLRADLIPAGTANYTDVKTVTQSGPYTTITFPRSYITQTGGWKVPSNVTTATTIVVGGGGGGGYGSSINRPAGGGGGGGVTASLTQSFTPGSTVSVRVGAGGLGGFAADAPSVRNGQSSILGVGAGLTALGGGGGANNGGTGSGGSGVATGGGSGASDYSCSGSPATPTSGTFVPGATVTSGNNGGGGVWGWGGSGGGARGAATNGTCAFGGGTPGPGFFDPVTNIEYGRGGSADSYSTTSAVVGNQTQNNGWGGIISYNGGNSNGVGYRGSTGTVVIRYLTAAKPSFTYPTNAYLNAGMVETFTTNVSQDSATAMLTRTFRWESTTAGSSGTFTTIKQGTGAANAAFSWVPSDTSTTGNQYLYRVVVTDSDTAGLFYTDTSTAVYAVINGALRMTGAASVSKTINIARNETFTISSGTPTYRYALSPLIPGVTLDTTTAGTTILKISDTVTVGTYSETLTVTDSVSASVSIPLTIKVNAPPSLSAGGEIVKNGQIINLDAGNSQSILLADGTVATSKIWNDISGSKFNATTTSALYNSTTCNAPTYSTDNGGILNFSGTDQTCYQTPFLGTHFTKSYTIEAWVKLTSAMTSGMQIISQAYSVQYDNIAMAIGGLDQGQAGKIFVGFFDGSAWRLAPDGYTPTLNTWFHILGTYDGSNMNTYINGTLFSTFAYTGGATTQNTKGFYIGKRWDGAGSAYHFSGSIGEMRAYNRALTVNEVTQNYNATKFRYTATYGQNIVKPSQKYGVLNLESFTVTSGGDTKTVTLAVGDRAGIDWDTTSTPGVVKLSVQESLTPGTYYDTVTVTDNFAVSTILPIKFTVTKADTLTVYIDTPTALNYTGSPASFISTLKSIGAVGLESGTALSATVKFKPAGTTCATGGYCRVGDIGPGGGIVFIDTSTASSDGRIYEVAPQNWSGSDDLSTVGTYCSNNNLNLGATQVGIGWGETNTSLARAACLGGAVARVNNFNLSNNTGYSDWFIPSKNEGVELAKIPASAGLLNIGNNWTTGKLGYWTSSESSTTAMWSIGHTGAIFNGTSTSAKSEAAQIMVRPVRAFRPCWALDTCTAISTTDTPTAAGIYEIVPSALTNSADLLTKYSAVTYSNSRLTINRIAQRAQVIPFINTNYPETYTVSVTEGNGNGAITYATVNGTASGCAFDYKKLYTTSQGTCTVTVTKAGDRNYLPDSVTANILFLAFVMNQPSPASGSGTTIALSGATAITLDPNAAPSITSLSTYTATPGSTQLVINGAGFNQADIASITVKFWRNVVASGFTINAGNSQITVTVPAGATTGKVTVTTPNGIAVSELPLTITP
jgi:hypothetical protein